MSIKADHNESTTGADASVEALILIEAIRYEATPLTETIRHVQATYLSLLS